MNNLVHFNRQDWRPAKVYGLPRRRFRDSFALAAIASLGLWALIIYGLWRVL